ncbi:MAG: hypothetical protein H6807_14010 [Planctomycetes bacterium]|nr:hypothetical protein [Planctomycetota bacterium]
MHLLTTLPEIKAAVATMNPIARDAAQSFSSYLLNNPAVMQNPQAMQEAYLSHCGVALVRGGISLDDEERVERWMEDHSESVLNVGLSIVSYVVNENERRRKWGWLGKAAAIAAGVVLGSIFG